MPIRIDLTIPSFQPRAPLPIPADAGVDAARHPQFKLGDPTPTYKLKDYFLWNLHESLITPKQFAMILVNELDLPSQVFFVEEISNQIRTQLEEYAGVALHPLFHTVNTGSSGESTVIAGQPSRSRDLSQTPIAPATPGGHRGNGTWGSSRRLSTAQDEDSISATALPIPGTSYDINNPDDTYRCIITLNINLLNKLYTDKFEWSLLHPPGAAEIFAKQTCADIGLPGEWVPAMAHAIYEVVLRLKKDACESGGLVGGSGYGGEIDNSAAHGQEAGWRYDPEHLADEWEPKVEILSKEEIEKREGDRERQIRRLRRETARFSSTTNISVGAAIGASDLPDSAETPMGRGERSKRKRRFRSLSPVGRGGTPGGTSETAGYGGGGGQLSERPVNLIINLMKLTLCSNRATWRCSYCSMPGSGAWAIRDGPAGQGVSFSMLPVRVVPLTSKTLCHNCGLLYERDKRLPPWMKNLHVR